MSAGCHRAACRPGGGAERRSHSHPRDALERTEKTSAGNGFIRPSSALHPKTTRRPWCAEPFPSSVGLVLLEGHKHTQGWAGLRNITGSVAEAICTVLFSRRIDGCLSAPQSSTHQIETTLWLHKGLSEGLSLVVMGFSLWCGLCKAWGPTCVWLLTYPTGGRASGFKQAQGPWAHCIRSPLQMDRGAFRFGEAAITLMDCVSRRLQAWGSLTGQSLRDPGRKNYKGNAERDSARRGGSGRGLLLQEDS